MKNNAHTFPGSDECGDTNKPEDDWEDAPCTARAAQREEQISEEAKENRGNAQTACEDNARSITVADGPSDEVWMCLTAERVLSSNGNSLQRRRMRCVLKCPQGSATLAI